MKSFKFVKVCLMALGVCSFAFAGIKAAPPPRASRTADLEVWSIGEPTPEWVKGYSRSYWEALSTSTKIELTRLRKILASKKFNRRMPKNSSLVAECLKEVHHFIKYSPVDDQISLYHVTGFGPLSENNEDDFCLWTQQFSRFSTISDCHILNKLKAGGYTSGSLCYSDLPNFLATIRRCDLMHWVIREKNKNTRKAQPVAMPAGKIEAITLENLLEFFASLGLPKLEISANAYPGESLNEK